MYTLKTIVQRGMLFGAAASLVIASVPSSAVFADTAALNPLTDRSLLLSSSAPGYQNTDGSGNSEDRLNANDEFYAPPGSGPNGQKSGQTFTFKVSTDSEGEDRPIKALTFQYCTRAAGYCQAPGNNAGDHRDLTRLDNETAFDDATSDLEVVLDGAVGGENFDIYEGDTLIDSTGWTLNTVNAEDPEYGDNGANEKSELTGKANFITLANETGIEDLNPTFNEEVKIVFKATPTHFITNPGEGSFFVKINTYDNATTQDVNTLIDGGVTVANVMTESIHITTKVLETMAFSVGIESRDTEEVEAPAKHGPCDPMQAVNGNRLDLGNPNAEYSLETDRAWDVHSYWRLSSNSSGGASVYYSGDTLKNTVGDKIAGIGTTAALSNPGQDQFGLAFVDDAEVQSEVSASFAAEQALDEEVYLDRSVSPLTVAPNYLGGSGNINTEDEVGNPVSIDASFAFDENSRLVPVVIASNTTDGAVLPCTTGKMRYIGNIGADTPAGVYTTKVNYLAAPQY